MQKYYYQRLRDIREDREKTQKEIAEVLNTTYQYYSAYERGVRDIPSHHIKTSCALLQHLRGLPFGTYGRAESAEIKFNARVRISLLTALGRYCIIN